jgi:urea transport system permease protein
MSDVLVEDNPTEMSHKGKTLRLIGGGLLLAALLALPLLPPPLAISDFRLTLLSRFLCYAIVAIGIDLIWGYAGILSLGHGVYLGLGAYCTAMYLKLEASGGRMPDFMAWSGVDTMPWWWQPFRSPWFALFMAILLPTLLAAFLGFLTFRSRVKGVFFSILSQALALVVVTLFIGQQGYTGGTNGMTNFKTIFGHDLNDISTQHVFFWLTVLSLAGVFALSRWLVQGRFGKILVAIRDGENRTRFIGYDPAAYKVFIYALSAAFAGLAGMLFVLQVGLITPTEMDIVRSIKMVLWVAIGGRATLTGAVVGAVLVNAAENQLSEKFPTIWSYFIGGAFLVAVLFLPQGIMGWLNAFAAKWKTRGWHHGFKRPRTESGIQSADAAEHPVY